MTDKQVDSDSLATSKGSLAERTSMPLHFDVLISIMVHIDKRADLLSFISTSSELYASGLPYLLRFPYRISDGNLGPFHQFLTSKGPWTFLALRDLQFYFREAKELAVGELELVTDILRKAQHLRSLRLQTELLRRFVAIAQAVASFAALHILILDGFINERTSLTLSQLRSPLKRVEIELGDFRRESSLTMLENLRDTLESATVKRAAFSPTDLCYTKVTALEISICSHIRLSILVPAFPNLRRLVLGPPDLWTNSRPTVEELRAENIGYQAQYQGVVWRLSELTADATALDVLALQTHVPSLTVRDFTGGHCTWLRSNLATIQPTRLKFMASVDPWGLSEFLNEGTEGLWELNIEVDYSSGFHDAIHKEISEILLRELNPLRAHTPRLAKLGLCLLFDVFVDDEEDARVADIVCDSSAWHELAHDLVKALPSIEMLDLQAVTTKERRWCWQVGDGGSLTEISSDRYNVLMMEFEKSL